MPNCCDVRGRLAAEVDRSLPRLVDMTRRLVAAASPNPPSDTLAVAQVAHNLLAEIPGIEIQRVAPEPTIVNIVARLRGARSGRRLTFNGHLDTFPIGEDLGWTVPPLGGVEKDGRLYGRGVCDMKGGIACTILAAALLAEFRDSWTGELVVTLAGDEENMGSLGTKFLLDNVPHATGDANICNDVGSPMVVRFGEKGLYWIEIQAAGAPAHGAHVHRGVNAIDRLRTALDWVKRLERIKIDAPHAVTEAIRVAKRISEPLSGTGEARTLGRITVNIGTIAGGVSPNLVPAHAVAQADVRLPIGVSTAEIDAKLEEWLSLLEGVSWQVVRRFEPNYTDPDHEIVRRVTDIGGEVLGRRPAINMRVGGSDSRWYRMNNVPTVVFGLTPHDMGGPDEHIMTGELVSVAKVDTLAAFDFLSAPH